MNFCQIVILISLAYGATAYDHRYSYYSKPLQFVKPKAFEVERKLTTEENPCTEEVLRAPEVQAFRDPLDSRTYIVCTDVFEFERMPCSTGTFFDPKIQHCVPKDYVPPVCPVGLCKNNADCIIDEVKNEYQCMCRTGFTGFFCETDIDECALEGNKACAGGKCIDQLNGYYCDFGNKLGVSQSETIPIPCTLLDLSLDKQFFEVPSAGGNVFLQCTGVSQFVVSRCADMLFWNQEIKTCSIERPKTKTGVCLSYPCKNDGECNDLGEGKFQCLCRPGFTGQLCEHVIDFCASSPCKNDGKCVSHPAGYNCICKNKIVDDSCLSGIENPCKKTSEYLAHRLSTNKFFLCGIDGLAFLKSCASGLVWDDLVKTCVSLELLKKKPKKAVKSIFDTPVVKA